MPHQTIKIPRAHLIMGLCLPLAVLIGYFVAEPLDSSSLGVLMLVLAVLSMPILMKWYHPLLVFSFNAVFVFGFLPGGLPMWVFVAVIGFLFAALNRCMDSNHRLMIGGALPRALLCLGAVVAATALATGGAGLRALGSSSYGGKHYLNITAAI